MRTATKPWAVLAILAALALAACAEKTGSTGDQGAPGADGAPGAEGAPGISVNRNPAKLFAKILSVSVASAPVVTFTLNDREDEFGLSYPDLSAGSSGQVRFTIAKLIPSSSGNASYWQNYIVTTETKDSGDPGTTVDGTKYTQGYYDRTGTLTYSKGVYTYTFAADITALTAPSGTLNTIDLTYDPTLTHRVAMQVSGGGLPVTNATYDFVPAGGTVSTTRNIVKTATCNQCHDQLALHGGGRIDTNYCVTCHNPGQYDANSGNILDFKVMVHRIHWAQFIPGVVSTSQGGGGTAYQIWGFNDNEFDYSAAVFPQMVASKTPQMRYKTPADPNFSNPSTSFFPTCAKCHDESDTSVTEAANWRNKPTKEACGACHDNIVFDGTTPASWQSAHTGGTKTNSQCPDCHATGQSDAVNLKHSWPALVDAERPKFQFNIETVTYSGGTVTVDFSVTDPTATSTYYNVKNDARWRTGTTSNGSLTVLIGIGAKEHTNIGNGSTATPASGITVDGLANSTDLGAGTIFRVTSALPTAAQTAVADTTTGGFAVGMYGRAAVDVDGDSTRDRIPVKAVVKYYGSTGSPLTTASSYRRSIVDIDNCNVCHGNLTLHGNGRQGNTQLCVICHNPNNTDLSQRLLTADVTTLLDGQKEQSIDFKVMIHGIHRGAERDKGLVVYGFGSNPFDFGVVEFPGHLNDCNNCHKTDTYTLPISTAALPTTVNTWPGSDVSLTSPIDMRKILGRRSFSWLAVNSGTDRISIPGHGFVDAAAVTFTVSAGAQLPAPLAISTTYYVKRVVDADTIEVYTDSGLTTLVDLTDSGLRGTSTSSTPFTITATAIVNAGAETITFAAHGLTNNQKVQFSASGTGNALPGGLSASTDYWVIASTADTFQVSASAGPGGAVNLTSEGSGVRTLTATELFDVGINGRTTPTASVCSACHDSTLSKRHMVQNGAGITGFPLSTEIVTQGKVDDGTYFETCALCHGEGRLADVKLVHEIEE